MKSSSLVVLAALVVTCAGFTRAENCSSTINDGAGVISNPAPLQEIANEISDRGGDPKIVTIAHVNGTLETYFKNVVRQCSSWQSSGGGIKNNLIIFAVVPKQHLFNILYGNEMHQVLDASNAAIKSQFMLPAFKDGDFARGILRGEEQVSQRLQAFNTAALHPQQVTTTVNNEATDMSGFWTFLFWVLGLGTVGFIAWAIYRGIQNSKRNKAAVLNAQQEAQKTVAMVAERISALSSRYEEKKALGENVDAKIKALGSISEDYSKLAGSASFNPNSDGLTAGNYESMTRYYRQMITRLDAVDAGFTGTKVTDAPRNIASYAPAGSAAQSRRSTTCSTPAATHTHTTTIINNDPGYIPVPVIIEDDRPSYRRDPDPEPASSYSSSYSSSSDSSSSFGGSSSSWSDSSSSSSSFDSGSSSSWSDSSSSSSDFGGGGDSSW